METDKKITMENEELEKENEQLKIQLENLKNARKSLLQTFLETNSDREVSFMEYMFLLFLGLKLSGVIEWNYLLVFAPIIVLYVIMLVKIRREEILVKKMVKEQKEKLKLEPEEELAKLKAFVGED